MGMLAGRRLPKNEAFWADIDSVTPGSDVKRALINGKLVKLERTIIPNLSGPSQKLLIRVPALQKP